MLVVHHVVVDVLVVGITAHLVRVDAKVVAKAVIVVLVVLVVQVIAWALVVIVMVLVVAVVKAAQIVPHPVTLHAQQAVEALVEPHVPAAQAVLTVHHVIQLAHRDAHHVLEDARDLVMSVVRVIATLTVLPLVRAHVLLIVQQHAFQPAKQQLGLVL